MKKEAIKVFDSHLHMGYISENEIIRPHDIKQFTKKHGVCGGAIMPTACRNEDDDFELHIDLYSQAIKEGFSPILYVTPRIIKLIKTKYKSLLEIEHFIGIKIHPDAVYYNNKDLEMVVNYACYVKLPVFIHTGDKDTCNSFRFMNSIKRHPEQVFVLCHARPAHEAFYLLNRYPNVWADTSFLPFEELQKYVNDGNSSRIIFGSDYPVNLWFPQLSSSDEWYQSAIDDILNNLSSEVSANILYNNYNRLKSQFANKNLTKL